MNEMSINFVEIGFSSSPSSFAPKVQKAVSVFVPVLKPEVGPQLGEIMCMQMFVHVHGQGVPCQSSSSFRSPVTTLGDQ